MASATIGIGNSSFVVDHVGKRRIENRCNDRSVVIGHQSRSRGIRKGSISATTASLEPIWKYEGGGKDKDRRNDAVDAYKRLDEWMKNSVVDIVKNLREAPLLVQVYPKKMTNGGEATAVRTERAMVDDWAGMVEKWETGETPLPEGVILVEELGDEGEGGNERRTTKAWGLVVQGRGVGSGPLLLAEDESGEGGSWNEPVLYPFLLSPGEEFQGNSGIAAQELLALAGPGIVMVPLVELI